MTTHLQGLGSQNAKPAREIKIGDTLIWNFGCTSKVIGILKETKTQIIIKTQTDSGEYERRLGKDRLVAVA
jgi:hypothetical protein